MMTAIAFESGRPIHYISGGRDWSPYVTALLHYQLVLDGDVQFDLEGMASEVLATTEDPFEQAAYLLLEHKKAKLFFGQADTASPIMEILSKVEFDPSDPSRLIGRAWEMVALHGDFAGARELLLTSPIGEHGPMIERALAALEAVAAGADTREILRARHPDRFHNRSVRICSGTAKFGRIEALQFQRLMQRIGSAEDAEDREAAYNHSAELLEFAESQGISTVIAMARVQLGEAEFERGNLERPAALFREAKKLRDAPSVQLSPLLPKIEPINIVNEALNWLVRVADGENNVDKRNATLQQLLALRTEFGAPEDVAWAAEQLGRSYGASGDLGTARGYFDQAHSEYTRVGRLSQAGWIKFLQAKAGFQQNNSDEALNLLQHATTVAVAADDSALLFQTSRLAGDIQWKQATKSSDRNLAQRATASFQSALEAARTAMEIAETQKDSTPGRRCDSYINLSIALNDLGTCIHATDAGSARVYYQEAVAIRRALVAEHPEDYWIARRLGYSLIYLAENARKLQDDEGPATWAQAVSQFSALTKNLTDSKTAAQDFSLSINHFLEKQITNPARTRELDALASVLPAIQEALRDVVEHAPPADAFKVTVATMGLATEFDGASMRSCSHDLFAATLDARRLLSNKSPCNRLIRRGLAFSLINTNFGLLPENSDSALSDFRESVSIFEDLAASTDKEGSSSAKSDLLTALMHSARLLSGASHPGVRELTGRAVEVARDLIHLAPGVIRCKEDLAWALLWSADAIPAEDTMASLGGYQAVLDLYVADGFPAEVHWLALVRSGRTLDGADPNGASRFYNKAVVFAKAQLAARPGDEDFEWRLARSLALAAETLNSIEPVGALAKWRECIDLQKRRLPSHQGDLKEIRLLAVALNNAGELVGSEDIETAIALYREADLHFRELLALDSGNPRRLRDLVEAGKDLAGLLSSSTPESHDAATIWEQVRRDIEDLATISELTQQESVLLRRASSFAAVAAVAADDASS